MRHRAPRFVLSTANLFAAPSKMPIDESERVVPGSPDGGSKQMIEPGRSTGRAKSADCAATCARAAMPRCRSRRTGRARRRPRPPRGTLSARDRCFWPHTNPRCSQPLPHCVRALHPRDHLGGRTFAAPTSRYRCSATYNLGNGAGYSVREVMPTAARDVLGAPVPHQDGPRRSGHPLFSRPHPRASVPNRLQFAIAFSASNRGDRRLPGGKSTAAATANAWKTGTP